MSTTLKLIGIVGILFFSVLFSLTFLSPEKIEASAKSFVIKQIENELRTKQHAIADVAAAEATQHIAARLGFEKEQIQSHLEHNLPEKIASIVASICSYDCDQQRSVAQSITKGYLDRIKNIQVAHSTLGDIVKGKYLEIVSKLKRDLRIFLGSNLMMFLILLAVAFAKPAAVAQLFLPGLLLLLATVLSSSMYIFGQDWFYTVLYNDYIGFGYLAYLCMIFAALLDIALNKARVITKIINGIANAVGSTFSVLPC